MTLPVSGPISLNAVNVELGLSGTTSINMNQASVRTLFGVPSGTIRMSDGYGKANQFAFTISSDTTNGNLRTLAVNAGWNQTSKVVATISAGIYVSANSTGTPGLTISGSFPGGVELINNGFIIGMGGNGGNGGGPFAGSPSGGGSGGTALSVSTAVSITNNGTVGGGGGGGQAQYNGPSGCCGTPIYGGAGGGGGRTGRTNSSGGTGALGNALTGYARASDGSPGTAASAGGGSASGGNWGSSGGSSGAAGGAAGACTSGNSNITWVVTGTRLGALN